MKTKSTACVVSAVVAGGSVSKTSINERKGKIMKKMTMMVPGLRAAVVLLVLAAGAGPAAATDWNVGTSAELQTALEGAVSGDTIHVAEGTYTPTTATEPADPRSATFQIPDGVTLLGAGENETVLSGEIGTASADDNVYSVVSVPTAGTAMLDGFTVTGGCANISTGSLDMASGGGMYVSFGAVTVSNVTFTDNFANNGGGMSLHNNAEGTLTNVTFSDNSASVGGGLSNFGMSMLENVTFSNNSVTHQGGGMAAYGYSELTNVTFENNSATFEYDSVIDGHGGGLYIYSYVWLTNVTFSGNFARVNGGGICAEGYSEMNLRHCTFRGNSADNPYYDGGGAIWLDYQADEHITNSIFWGNTPNQFNGVPDNTYYCIVQDYDGTSPYIITENPLLGTFGDNGGYTRTIPLLEGSPAIDAALYWGNWPSQADPPATDQRGVSRPQGAANDIGAYEVEEVVVGNNPPQIDGIFAPVDPVPVSTLVEATADFTDPDADDTHTADWDWGDGSTSDADGSVDETHQIAYGNHTYSSAGVYTVTLTLTDAAGASATATYEYVVVYDPAAGFVTGGGWIDSPAGAYEPDPALSGKATFGFVSKYKKGTTIPTGNTEFQFKAGDLNFHSTSYDWLVVTGSDYAMFKGIGQINGSGAYKFMIWAGDSDPDTFRIRIWTEDEITGVETDVYDNGSDQAIGGGNIVIHAK